MSESECQPRLRSPGPASSPKLNHADIDGQGLGIDPGIVTVGVPAPVSSNTTPHLTQTELPACRNIQLAIILQPEHTLTVFSPKRLLICLVPAAYPSGAYSHTQQPRDNDLLVVREIGNSLVRQDCIEAQAQASDAAVRPTCRLARCMLCALTEA